MKALFHHPDCSGFFLFSVKFYDDVVLVSMAAILGPRSNYSKDDRAETKNLRP